METQITKINLWRASERSLILKGLIVGEYNQYALMNSS